MSHFVTTESQSKDVLVNLYQGIAREELNEKVDEIFKASGYKLVEGSLGDATYEKGNRVVRILLGAFVKYFKFKVITASANETQVRVSIVRASTGMSGGVIGMNQVKKEQGRLSWELQTV